MLSSPFDVFFAGTVAGGTEICTTIPLEVIKTQMQLHPDKYRGIIHAGRTIVASHGVGALYSGLPILLCQVSGKVGFRFTIFDQFKKKLRDENGNLSTRNKIISGFGTGLMEGTLITTPTERIKVLQQNQFSRATTRMSGLGIARDIISTQGIWGLWKGLVPTVSRQCVNTGLRLSLYEPVKSYYQNLDKPAINNNIGIVSGASVGFLGAIVTQPIDVVKSYTQANSQQIKSNISKIYNNLGLIGFFQGIRPRLWRMTLSQAITFGTYEFVFSRITNRD